MGAALVASQRPSGKNPPKESVTQTKLFTKNVNKLGVIAQFLKMQEGREVSIAEAHNQAVGDALDAFYLRALKEMQEAALREDRAAR